MDDAQTIGNDMSESNGEIDQQLVRALAHPLRVQILRILEKCVASPNQMAGLTRKPLGNVSYHTKVLLKYGCIELVDTVSRRGAVEHFYQAKSNAAIGSRNWQELPELLRSDLAAANLEGFLTHVIAALEGKAFQARKDSSFAWQQFTVDESGWKEIQRILEDGQEGIRRVGEKCAKRLGVPNQGISIIVALSAFEAEKDKGQSG
jgi:DNA-binding transcriptional ArsR family regulator